MSEVGEQTQITQTRIRKIAPGVHLFLLTLPFLIIVFLFYYLPLYGWSYAFFDYRAGMQLLDTPFVGFKHFRSLVANPVLVGEVLRVMRNTLVMSLLGLLASSLPVAFAILLTEVRSASYRKIVQTLTTIPHFISWILVYSVVWSMLSVTDGFVNRLLISTGVIEQEINFLVTTRGVWFQMLGYQIWKTLGWSAILYLAAIAGIDQELYQAATVDGAGRFRLIRHITIPGVMPTYFVLLLFIIANFINNGLEQYFVFQNPMNKAQIEVLDLYVYNMGMVGSNIPLATAVSMLKSIVGVVLLFVANSLSTRVRGDSII